ncbi:UDP-N-acetylmuramate/alanine ligase [Pseudopedobacter saltans DSM 12145]|uniref:UDP-N-acetylmuramate--L-alanine ligase n=1 Tax=Pseudopedobacter saltans (strain ATCC 51119 / DSM 12145 / JCM 21818 / CCUG 39354 / LMG 10337 / NBRC 100064 / NCIMB 13643) TaxID=762903 RepID=F0SCY2_PSESL|nr:UDP-N-acetylmuramate--L-alanine ligase [Pseudopedobacter saltans]ADY50721.1 UDP-N-acetylmuramate/alanine ligase [Pseudopedobacter saltans DSM 12145]
MVNLEDIKRVYLVGIGGISMSSLARYFQKRGCQVAGYDKTSTVLTRALESEGIPVSYKDELEAIPAEFRIKDSSGLVIYTPAVPKNSVVYNYFADAGFDVYKRSQILGLLSRGMFTIAVAGTHGKTTTSCLITHLLRHGGNQCSAFLGGISVNYYTNLIIGENEVMVVEADEYDRSFLTLHPNIAVITSMDADHLDIYGDKSHLTESFELFASQVDSGGTVFLRKGLDVKQSVSTYAIEQDADAKAVNIRVEDGEFRFDFSNDEIEMKDLVLGLPGQHNIENAVAAIQVALKMGISQQDIKSGLKSFKGVKRRFEYIVKTDAFVYIDDYAHHPEELRACFRAVRTLYPTRKFTAIFQPHLFTRTRDFIDGFAEVLSSVDELILLEIYPARELPIEGINSQFLLDKITLENKKLLTKDEVLKFIKNSEPELLVTVGAGDIDTLIKPIKEIYDNA